jgi:hypothetical protein
LLFLCALLAIFSRLGHSLFRKFENLGLALQYAYPDAVWDLNKFSFKGKKSEQRWLKVHIEEILHGVEIIENYKHPELTWGNFAFILDV